MPSREAIDRYVARIADETSTIFGDRLVGVWLIGSLAYGGFGPSSDVDIQGAVRNPTDREIAQLAKRISHPTLPCPAEGLEFVLYEVGLVARRPRRRKTKPDRECRSGSAVPADRAMGFEATGAGVGRGGRLSGPGHDRGAHRGNTRFVVRCGARRFARRRILQGTVWVAMSVQPS